MNDPSSKTGGESTSSASSGSTSELFKSNLFRYECNELLSESHLHLYPKQKQLQHSESNLAVKWNADVHNYISNLQDIILNHTFSSKTTKKNKKTGEDFVLPIPTNTASNSGSSNEESQSVHDLKLKSDKFTKLGSDWKIPCPNAKDISINTLVGSYAGGSMTTKEANGYVLPQIDVTLTVGKGKNTENEFWMQKDYLNYRYLDKRNILMHYIATTLRHKKHRGTVGKVSLSQMSSCPDKITIILTPPAPAAAMNKKSGSEKKKKKKPSKFRVRLLLGIPKDLFSPTRYFPSRNNLPAFLTSSTGTDDDDIIGGTPFYNSSVISSDRMYGDISSLLMSANNNGSSLSQATVILKVWLAQRGMRNGHDTINSTGLSLMLVYLLKKKMISARMSAWEMIRIWLKFVSETDWLGTGDNAITNNTSTDGDEESKVRTSANIANNEAFYNLQRGKKSVKGVLIMPLDGLSETQQLSSSPQTELYKQMVSSEVSSSSTKTEFPSTLVEAYRQSSDGPIFLDSSLTCNYLAHCSPSAMRDLAYEAKKSLNLINNCGEKRHGVFGKIFCQPSRFWKKFDVHIKVPIENIDCDKVWSQEERGGDGNSALFKWKAQAKDLGKKECITRGIIELLSIALDNRVTTIRPLTCGNGEVDEHSKNGGDDEIIRDADEILSFSVDGKRRNIMDDTIMNNSSGGLLSTNETIVTTCQPNYIVIGMNLNPETAPRIVNRGPPAEDSGPSSLFVSLWGKQLAQLRRFKDGSIVHSVVWKDVALRGNENEYASVDATGGVVEKIIQHILQLHFLEQEAPATKIELRNIVSLVDGLSPRSNPFTDSKLRDPTYLHKEVMKAFDSLSDVLKSEASDIGLPLGIDGIEGISPYLRYSSLFPPIAHPLLGGPKGTNDGSKVPGVTPGEPIVVQIRFEVSKKWPTDIEAMSAAKCAMLIKLAEGIKENRYIGFDGPCDVYSTFLDIGYMGYSWRIIIRPDQELKMLDSLKKPSAEAVQMRQNLLKTHVVSSLHHSTIRALHNQYPSAGPAVRLAQRWIASHMLSGCLPLEALEIIVMHGYIDSAPLDPPTTASAGFLRFLHKLSHFNWKSEPFIFDAQGHLSPEDVSNIHKSFEAARGQNNGPPMFIITPFDRLLQNNSSASSVVIDDSDMTHKWIPAFTSHLPEQVILSRMKALALISYRHLMDSLIRGDGRNNEMAWSSVFCESPSSLKSYSVLFRVTPEIILDQGSCSSSGGDYKVSKHRERGLETPFTKSLRKRYLGPKPLMKKAYKNLTSNSKDGVMHGWQPVEELVSALRTKFGSYAVFFYNELSPDIIAMLWRPTAFQPQPFSVINSEFKRPVDGELKEGTLILPNSNDILREIKYMGSDVFVDVKIIDDKSFKRKDRGEKRKADDLTESESSSSSEDEDE